MRGKHCHISFLLNRQQNYFVDDLDFCFLTACPSLGATVAVLNFVNCAGRGVGKRV